MKTRRYIGLLITLSASAHAQVAEVRLQEAWRAEYAAEDATGEHVVGLWHFNADEPTRDASGHGHDLRFDGVRTSAGGRFGSCLESFRGWPDEDVRHAALAPNDPSLTPKGAFSIELWIQPKPDLEGYPDAFLVDKKYVAHDDYQMVLGRASKDGRRRLRVSLGFGTDSETYHSDAARFDEGVWYHVAFVYDGAGAGRFYLNGVPFGGDERPGRKSISPGRHLLSIGDRIGSYYHGFPGYIDEVRICNGALRFAPASLDLVSARTVFVRMEQNATVRLALTNLRRTELAGAVLRASLGATPEAEFAVPTLAPGQRHTIEYALDTSLRPGEYRLRARVDLGDAQPDSCEESFPIIIAPRKPSHRMPVLMWGVYGAENVLKEMERLKRIGFTHVLGVGADYQRIWEADEPTEAEKPEAVALRRRMLNEALANGMSVCASLSPGSWARGKKEFLRVNRDGEPYERQDICGLFPELKQFCHNVGASVAQTYGEFPAFDSALIHTEVRDSANVCFHEHDKSAFREYAGFDIPEAVTGRWGTSYEALKGFPASRVIPDDHPLYVYYKWYWKHGDGWNALNTAVHEGLKSVGREDLWTFHDPAVRVASTYGSGGAVDVLSQWTYSYPDPIRIATATDELLAMARGPDHPQEVMKMTQIIWYRSQTAPAPKEGEEPPAFRARWEQEQPDAQFITIAPMHLREAFWTKIARPIKGIMYHGWQSLVPCEPPSGYRYTHPQTQHELSRLIREVVEPLGPTLLQVPGVKSDVAFLESFASEMFAHRGTYGWGRGWAGDAYLIMQWAGLQPEIIFDETVTRRGLDGFRVLVMMDCDVITQAMADRIEAFQKRGGIIVGDERLCPAIEPDVVIKSYKRTGKADEDKAALQALAADLRAQLDRRYRRYLDSSNPDVVTYRRRYGTTDYVFAINDNREFGEYVGQHGLVMENGLPSDAVLTLRREAGFVYDLVNREAVSAKKAKGRLSIEARLRPCDGRLFMITERPIAGVRIEGPDTARLGQSVAFDVTVVDADGRPVDAVVPVRVDILDPDGRDAELSGYYGAAGGRLHVPIDVAPNDVPGTWQISVRELASGRRAERYLRVVRGGR